MRHLTLVMILLIALTLLSALPVSSQADFWQQTSGPTGGEIHAIDASLNGYVYTGTWNFGAYRSTDNGSSWLQVWSAPLR